MRTWRGKQCASWSCSTLATTSPGGSRGPPASAGRRRAAGVGGRRRKARSVGFPPATGADFLLADGARWLAFTDADSRVSSGWLVAQLSLDADAVCGSIAVDDWTAHPHSVREYFRKTYVDADGHRHVHGANLGVSDEGYRRAGVFLP